MAVKRVKSKTGRQKAQGHTPSGARTRQSIAAQAVAREAAMPYPRFSGDYTLPLVAVFVAFWSVVGLWYILPQSSGAGASDKNESFARENPNAEVLMMEDEPADPRSASGSGAGGSPLPISPRSSASSPARLPVVAPSDAATDPKKKIVP
ncbi:MAG: hypothetical protein ACAI35_27635 [Candidatus Methylacidiphilales bacterium]|nr:hypothetical protein [Candidatus Methylacidiphilales bacterium]